MGLFNTLHTAVSGMSAQSSLLSAVGDNIANSNTVGYKEASAQFETMLGLNAGSNYESGGVQTSIRYAISDPGSTVDTTSATDLAIQGNGFFVVQNSSGQTAMTRAGSFLPDASTGNLVNTAGYSLMGYPINSATGVTGTSLQPVNTTSSQLQAAASSSGTLEVNLPSTATDVATANLPSANTATSTYTGKTSVTAYDNLGNAVNLDVYYAKTADATSTTPATWEMSVYNAADATKGGFPYVNAASGTADTPLATATLGFNATTGQLTSADGGTTPAVTSLAVTLPGTSGGNTVAFDISKTTQLAAAFNPTTAPIANGSAPGKLSSVSIGADGTLTSIYSNGAKIPSYKIPLATVSSPDNLTPINGNAYQANATSGAMTIGGANSGGYGSIASDTLEQSTVDIAAQLTDMIASQRAYEANSKVLQTSSDLLSLINKLQS